MLCIIRIIFFSILIINTQMAQNSKLNKFDSEAARGKNVILVSNQSENFADPTLNFLLSRNSSRNAPDFAPRNTSMSNLFAGFQQQKRIRQQYPKKQEQMSDSQRYAQECLQYQKFLFDEKIKMIIHRMAILAYNNFREKNEHPFLTFFIERLLCALAKKLLLNRFQLLFLQYVFEQSKWKYDIDVINLCSNEFKSFVYITESENPHGMVKNLQIYLLYCAYYSKKSLNDLSSENFYNHFLKGINEKFKDRYQEWTESSGVTKIKVNPKTLNIIFKKLTSSPQQREKDYTDNYNLLVEEILQISPAYNADKQNRRKKKIKREEEQNQQNFRENDSNNIQQLQHVPQISQSQNDFPSLNIRKKKTSYVSNVDGFDAIAYYNRNN